MTLTYYADYEALEFKNGNCPVKEPKYLEKYETNKLVPLVLTCANKNGNIAHTQVATPKNEIQFFKMIDSLYQGFYILKRKRIKNCKKDTLVLYFHFLNYDFNIIIYELFEQGYKQYVDITNDNITYTNLPNEPDKIFTILGKDIATSVGINFKYKNLNIELRDTFRILSQPQDDILKSFGFPLKPSIDFDNFEYNRDINNLVERCKYDTQSLAKSFETFFKEMSEIFGNIRSFTASGIAFKYFKNELGFRNMEDFREMFPLQNSECKLVSKLCYNGGVTTKSIRNVEYCENVQMVDINASYSKCMTFNLPYGNPTKVYKEVESGYTEYFIKVKFEINEGMTPFLRCHSHSIVCSILDIKNDDIYKKSNFPTNFNGYLAINSIDLELLNKYYKCKYKIIYGFNYKTKAYLKDSMLKLYEHRQKFKENGDTVKNTGVKLIQNSLYGKFAQDLSGKVNLYDTIDSKTKVIAIDNNSLYIPLSSAVSAYARQNLINVVDIIKENFLYTDTDSVYFENPTKVHEILKNADLLHNFELGKWAYEYKSIEKAKFLGKKLYMFESEDENIVKAVGLNKRFTHLVNFDNFEIGSEFEVKKMIKINGGLAMRETLYTIKERF